MRHGDVENGFNRLMPSSHCPAVDGGDELIVDYVDELRWCVDQRQQMINKTYGHLEKGEHKFVNRTQFVLHICRHPLDNIYLCITSISCGNEEKELPNELILSQRTGLFGFR